MINSYALNCCMMAIHNLGYIPSSYNYVRNIVEQDEDFVEDLNKYYPDTGEMDSYIMDTQDRDILYDLIANHFTERNWPMNMESNIFEEFKEKLERAMISEGWRVINDGSL